MAIEQIAGFRYPDRSVLEARFFVILGKVNKILTNNCENCLFLSAQFAILEKTTKFVAFRDFP